MAISEKVVRSDHGVQKDGEAIREVVRILHEHISSPAGPTRPEYTPVFDRAAAAIPRAGSRPELLPSLPR